MNAETSRWRGIEGGREAKRGKGEHNKKKERRRVRKFFHWKCTQILDGQKFSAKKGQHDF